jgi:predicted Rossmann fold nucleotide-binding protein DprA/Smf involved in DNA uptake
MIIAIVGSREYPNLKRVWEYLDRELVANQQFRLVTGGARGVDTEAERWALARGIGCEVIKPVDPRIKVHYLYRNIEIITTADKIVAFHDGTSRGTQFVIDYATKRNKPLEVVGIGE